MTSSYKFGKRWDAVEIANIQNEKSFTVTPPSVICMGNELCESSFCGSRLAKGEAHLMQQLEAAVQIDIVVVTKYYRAI